MYTPMRVTYMAKVLGVQTSPTLENMKSKFDI